ncbi:MAG: OsmC family protein [Bacteroidota bacterium]|nr:OsmC family protein [Bacteroidota bacterium]
MTAAITYTGNLRCRAEHIQSGTVIESDAPTDNRGRGEKFSPTDLTCVSLAGCMLTTMAIKANDLEVNMQGARADVTKHMLSDPRRIGRIEVSISLPAGANERDRKLLETTGNNCPVAKSLHPDIELVINYNWEE